MSTNITRQIPIGIGVDIVELNRFRTIKYLSRIAELVLTPIEYERFLAHPDQIEYLASRFALKEAVIKAYPGLLTYRDVEIIKTGKKPQARLLIKNPQVKRMLVSLSHSVDYAVGFALAF